VLQTSARATPGLFRLPLNLHRKFSFLGRPSGFDIKPE
jgi:hypothetical protein